MVYYRNVLMRFPRGKGYVARNMEKLKYIIPIR